MFIVSSGGCPILGSYCVIVERMFSLQDHSETPNLLPMDADRNWNKTT